MTLQTGNKGFTPLQIKRRQNRRRKFVRGFLLFEVIITTAVLALGILFIYGVLLACLDYVDYCSNHLYAIYWMDEQMWHTQNEVSLFGSGAHIDTGGEFVKGNKNFRWNLLSRLIDGDEGLYKIDLSVNWQEAQRQIRLKRTAYARYAYEEE